MKTMTLAEFKETLEAQGVSREQYKFICPHCKTIQCAQDLIDAGAGKTFDEVKKYLAFSCVGRFTKDKGCNWTLGGLFQIHELEVITPDGEHHPWFEPVEEKSLDGSHV